MCSKLDSSKSIIIAIAVLHNIAVNSRMPVLENVPEPVEVLEFYLQDKSTARAVDRRIIELWF